MGRRGLVLEWQGRAYSVAELAAEYRLSPATLRYRLTVRQLPLERALATGVATPAGAARMNARRRSYQTRNS